VNVAEFSAFSAIRDAFDTLLFGGDRYIRVYGPIGRQRQHIELILPDAPLRAAMLIYARNVAVLSLIISLITASLVFMAINRIAIRPIRRMTENDAVLLDGRRKIPAPSSFRVDRDDELTASPSASWPPCRARLQETLKEPETPSRRSRTRRFQDQPRHAQHPRLRAADVRPPVDGR
jgi:hypothetical protein